MKKISLALFCALMCVKAFSQYPDNNYATWPEWPEIMDLKEKVQNAKFIPQEKKNELLNSFQKLKVVVDGYYYGTNSYCIERKQYDTKLQNYENEASQYTSQCSGTVDQSKYQQCVNWYNQLQTKQTELNNWRKALDEKGYQLIDVEATNNNNAFIKDAKEALTAGFTGTKAYHLTAKSWINTQAISEITPTALALKNDLSPSDEPHSPAINPGIHDYKLYQTFVVEVKFQNGKVISARFLDESMDVRQGKSYFSKGKCYEKEKIISDWEGKESVTFTRTVAAHSSVVALKEKVFGEHSPDIYNTISIEVFADKVKTHGYASDFPTTYFWIGDKQLAPKLQVQPSDYFK